MAGTCRGSLILQCLAPQASPDLCPFYSGHLDGQNFALGGAAPGPRGLRLPLVGYRWGWGLLLGPGTQENGCATSETASMPLALGPSQASRPASSTKIYAEPSLSMWAY